MEQERSARETLKRRFAQTQEDVSYMILALIPDLAEQIIEGMDIEALTRELQARSRVRQGRLIERPPSSVASSIDVVHNVDQELQETRSDAGSVVVVDEGQRDMATSMTSWIEASSSSIVVTESSSSPPGHHLLAASSESIIEVQSSLGVLTNDSGDNSSVADSGLSDSMISSSDFSGPRTKTELWNEVKMLTFTRTLTTLYSTTLLTLLTTIQLTILAHTKYVHSVLQQERSERLRERLAAELTMSNILLGGGRALEDLMAGTEMEGEGEEGGISEEVESKYLTLSWWLLHVGWKDVGERVRRGVEEVFDGVSLKSKLAAKDLHRLLSDVRKKVERVDGTDRRTSFASVLFPPTPETIQHVLIQGGFQQTRIDYEESAFTALLEETRSVFASSDFSLVLQTCLDQAAQTLLAHLESKVFVDSATSIGSQEDVRIRLAGLLPGLAGWSMEAMRGVPNELVDGLLNLREVKALSAIVFSRFEEKYR